MKFLYRYNQARNTFGSGVDVHGEYSYGNLHYVEVFVEKYLVYKETEKGFWISYNQYSSSLPPKFFDEISGNNFNKKFDNYRFVLKHQEGDKKRFAYETEEKALNYYIIKRTKYRNIMQHHLVDIETSIKQALKLKKKLNITNEI